MVGEKAVGEKEKEVVKEKAALAASLVAQDLLLHLYEEGSEPSPYVLFVVDNIVELAYAVAFRGRKLDEDNVKNLLEWIRALEEWLTGAGGERVMSATRERILLHFKCVEEMLSK